MTEKIFQKDYSHFGNIIGTGCLVYLQCQTESELSLKILAVIIPELSEPPVRTLGATIPENESHIFR